MVGVLALSGGAAYAATSLDSSVWDCEGRAKKDNELLQRELVDRVPQDLIANVNSYILCDSGDLASFEVELKTSASEASRALEAAGWDRASGSAGDRFQRLHTRIGDRKFDAYFEGTTIYAKARESAMTSWVRLFTE